MVDGCYDVELEFPVGGGLEDSRVNLDFFNARSIELLERGDNASFLPSPRRPVDEEVGEVSALRLGEDEYLGCGEEERIPTRDRRRSERSRW